jgi:L-rhamnose mutarotase
MKRFCLALDLKDDPALIAEYEAHHKTPRPEIKNSITGAGITVMDIYRTGNRLFMILETTDDFDFSAKAAMDTANEKVQEWEALMWKYQEPLPWAAPGEKWVLMEKIFQL